jgi:predicted RNA-binding Zn ribbon-like protein
VHVFVSGNLALDFIGTLKWRRSDQPEELLGDPGALDAWLLESGTVSTPPESRASDLIRARELREATYRVFAAALDGGPGPDDDVALLNLRARGRPTTPVLSGRSVDWQGNVDEALSTVARSAISALVDPEVSLLKECGRRECTRIYLDRSRGRQRTWCGMDECGNRVKAAAYRERRKARPSA